MIRSKMRLAGLLGAFAVMAVAAWGQIVGQFTADLVTNKTAPAVAARRWDVDPKINRGTKVSIKGNCFNPLFKVPYPDSVMVEWPSATPVPGLSNDNGFASFYATSLSPSYPTDDLAEYVKGDVKVVVDAKADKVSVLVKGVVVKTLDVPPYKHPTTGQLLDRCDRYNP